jgi:hypothetical protein|tara:strand:+ start:813 stop:1127 length:315 start_codon:yes stop_codon:yes gene_type:complete
MTIFTWNTANFKWNENPYLWSEVELILEIADGNGDTSSQGIKKKVEKLKPEKKKRLIHLIMRRKGIKIYEKSKVVKEDIEIDIKDVELIIKEVKAQIAAENIHV